jgi:hypothetical protein
MQFEITDRAAITFAQEFYAATSDGYPVDAALASARKAIFAAENNDIEWWGPPNGQLFSVNREAARQAHEEKRLAEAARQVDEERQRAEAARQAAEEKQRAEAARLVEEQNQRAEEIRRAEEEELRAVAARRAEEERNVEAARREAEENQRAAAAPRSEQQQYDEPARPAAEPTHKLSWDQTIRTQIRLSVIGILPASLLLFVPPYGADVGFSRLMVALCAATTFLAIRIGIEVDGVPVRRLQLNAGRIRDVAARPLSDKRRLGRRRTLCPVRGNVRDRGALRCF